MKLTGPIQIRFTDQQQDRQRQNFEQRISELQKIVASLTTNATTEAPSTIASGRYLGRQILDQASGTYTSTPGTILRVVRQIAAGGGGGGANGAANASGAGGNSGWSITYRVRGLNLNGTYKNDPPGLGGTGAPTAGGTGGDTVFKINGISYITKGGTGGNPGNGGNGTPAQPASGTTTQGIDGICCGLGLSGGMEPAGQAYGGAGGGVSPFGVGGYEVNAGPAHGANGTGRGAGGSGGAVNSFGIAGGDATLGVIWVDEYS